MNVTLSWLVSLGSISTRSSFFDALPDVPGEFGIADMLTGAFAWRSEVFGDFLVDLAVIVSSQSAAFPL